MPGNNTFVYKNDRPWPNTRLGTASIVGHTTDSSTRLWFRTGSLGRFVALVVESAAVNSTDLLEQMRRVPLASDELREPVQTFPFTVKDWSSDTTVVLDIEGLAPDTEYYYALYLDSDNPDERRIYLGHDALRRFRTMPREDSATPISFGFYSCHRPYDVGLFGKTHVVNLELWDMFLEALDRHSGRTMYAVSESSPRDLKFVIGGGDQAYVDGVSTLDIWKYLNSVMRLDAEGNLMPTVEDMASWYRDIYRGYWGFRAFQTVHANYPTYMIWDDHELHDGWGSYFLADDRELTKYFVRNLAERGLTVAHGRELVMKMIESGVRVYGEYEHSHNPPTPAGQFDYGFTSGPCAIYVLDGRGYRDVSRDSHRILGTAQLARFQSWLESPTVKTKSFIFLVSAVPVFHLRPLLGHEAIVSRLGSLADDLRDSWEHELHHEERNELLQCLFDADETGHRVVILSGDVHLAAAFKIRNGSGNVIYQLTSSAITYNVSRALGYLLGLGVPDSGITDDGYEYERLALYRDANFSIVKADPDLGQVTFQLYGRQSGTEPEIALGTEFERLRADLGQRTAVYSHSIAKLQLDFT